MLQVLKSLIVLAIVAALFIFFKPKIMYWLGMTKKEFAPVTTKVNATYQEFKDHDIYEREKKIIDTLQK